MSEHPSFQVGDKVTHGLYPTDLVGRVVHVDQEGVTVDWPDMTGVEPCRPGDLTLAEPAVEHIGTNVFEALERPDAAELFAKAELVSRVRDIMDGFERSRFPQIADEILKAVRAYREL